MTRTYEIAVSGADVPQDVKICLRGDVNEDGSINSKEVTRLRQQLKAPGTYVLSDYANLLANANGDASVNTKDVTRLRQYLKAPASYSIG